MPKAFIGLGSNLGSEFKGIYKDPRTQIDDALEAIAQNSKINLLKTSSFYQTPAIGPGNQPDYVNAAAKIETSLTAYELLEALQLIERQQGRVRNHRWGARTLDLDILIYDKLIENTKQLTLPHPRAHKRAFVLAPLADLEPNLIIADHGNARNLLANCSMQGIVRLTN